MGQVRGHGRAGDVVQRAEKFRSRCQRRGQTAQKGKCQRSEQGKVQRAEWSEHLRDRVRVRVEAESKGGKGQRDGNAEGRKVFRGEEREKQDRR